MCNVERVYKKLTGLDPLKDLEPPLQGAALIKELKQLRSSVPSTGDIFRQSEPISYEILETGIAAQEQFTLIGRKFEDGRTEAAFVFGMCLEPNMTKSQAELIENQFWIPYTEENHRDFL